MRSSKCHSWSLKNVNSPIFYKMIAKIKFLESQKFIPLNGKMFLKFWTLSFLLLGQCQKSPKVTVLLYLWPVRKLSNVSFIVHFAILTEICSSKLTYLRIFQESWKNMKMSFWIRRKTALFSAVSEPFSAETALIFSSKNFCFQRWVRADRVECVWDVNGGINEFYRTWYRIIVVYRATTDYVTHQY